MTPYELGLCISAVASSSAAQLLFKAAATDITASRNVLLLIVGAILMSFSMTAAIWVLQTLRVSQLVPFAAGAYILVPLGGRIFFKEMVSRRFWLGAMSIIAGIILTFWN
ncbi:MAG TPA: hypothetical protein VEZ24_17650 [Microvirga sp.]|nr:hypothetical protein [Microvirga sp.]